MGDETTGSGIVVEKRVAQNGDLKIKSPKHQNDGFGKSDNMQLQPPSKFSYPKGVYFSMLTEMTERFAYYVPLTILTFFLRDRYSMDNALAKLLLHAFICLSYLTPIIGSILSDSLWGAYNIVLHSSTIYSVGFSLATFGSIRFENASNLDQISKICGLIGLVLIALASGARKPCSAAFAANQFPPDMHRERRRFFSYFYLSMSVGMVLSQLSTPTLRVGLNCLNEDTCYPLAFGAATIVMTLSTVIFLGGTSFYVKGFRKSTVILKTVQCIAYSLKRSFCAHEKSTGTLDMNEHNAFLHHRKWLRVSVSKYGLDFVRNVCRVVDVSALFVPAILYWALYDQMFSAWLIQTDHMDGRLGSLNIPPDQMAVLFSVMVIVTIPVVDHVVYPVCDRCFNFLNTPLQKIGLGYFLAAASFTLAGLVQVQINRQIREVDNAFSASPYVIISVDSLFDSKSSSTAAANHDEWKFNSDHQLIKNVDVLHNTSINRVDLKNVSAQGLNPPNNSVIYGETGPPNSRQTRNLDQADNAPGDNGVEVDKQFFIVWSGNNSDNNNNATVSGTFSKRKEKFGYCRVYVVFHPSFTERYDTVSLLLLQDDVVSGRVDVSHREAAEERMSVKTFPLRLPIFKHKFFDVRIKLCDAVAAAASPPEDDDRVENCTTNDLGQFAAENGAADILAINENLTLHVVPLLPPHKTHLLWQMPQYILMAASEATFGVAGMEFAYSQASRSMKSVMQAICLVTCMFGNILAMLTSGTRLFKNPAVEFFVYALLMIVFLAYFISMARNYKYNEDRDKIEEIINLDKPKPEDVKKQRKDDEDDDIDSFVVTYSF